MPTARELENFADSVGLEVEPFQRKILQAVASGTREVAVLLPRGNGKTALMALVAVHHLVTVKDARIVVAAASRDQATHLFAYAERFARELGDPHLAHRYLELRWYDDPFTKAKHGSFWSRSLHVLASDPPKLHGLTYSLAIADEVQAHEGDGVLVALASALHKRPDAQLISISTAAQGAESPLGRLRARALALPSVARRGALTDARGPGLRYLDWSVADDVEPTTREVLRANPASWITAEAIEHQRAGLPDGAFRRYIANQWVALAGHWLPAGAWQRCITSPTIEPGETVVVGVDVGGERSATAVAWATDDLRVGVEILHGDGAVLEARDVIAELAETFVVRECVFDPWRAQQIALELEERGIQTIAFPQSDSRMIPASSRLHSAVVEQRLQLPDVAELHEHAANAVAKHSRRGWRIDRPDPTGGRVPIDAIIALAMAVDSVENQAPAAELLGFV